MLYSTLYEGLWKSIMETSIAAFSSYTDKRLENLQ